MASDYEKERQEALEAGEKALDSLSRAKECLQSAFDGLFTDLAMQSRISDAQTGVDEAIRRVEEIMSRL